MSAPSMLSPSATLRTPAIRVTPRQHRIGPATVLGLAVAGMYAVLALARFFSMKAGVDLAIFTQAAQRYAHGQLPWSDIKGVWGFNLLGDHFSPILALLGPVYAAVPHAWVLLIVQAVLIGVTAGVITRVAIDKLGTRVGVLCGILYAAGWGTQGLALFDFHEVAFALPLLAIALTCVMREQYVAAAWWTLPLMLVKEDSVFLVLGIALVLLWKRRFRLAGLIAAYGIITFLLIVTMVIPAISYYGRYTYWSSSAAAAGDPLTGALSNLRESIGTGAAPMLMLVLLLPTAGLALRSPLLLAAVPSLASRLTAPDPGYWGLDLHYNGTVTVIVALAFVDALTRIDKRRTQTILVSVALTCTAVMAVFAPAARVITEATYAWDSDRAPVVVINNILGHVPDGARVAAADAVAPYLVDRAQVFGLHEELRDSTGTLIEPDYVALDRVNPYGWQNIWVNAHPPSDQEDYQFLGEALYLMSPYPYDISVFQHTSTTETSSGSSSEGNG